MYSKSIIAIVVIVLVILILLFLALDTKKTVTNVTPVVPPNPNSAVKVSIETITITTSVLRLESTAMNLQLKVNVNSALPAVSLIIPPLTNSIGRVISINNVSTRLLQVITAGAGVVFPSTIILPAQTVTFKAVRDNEYVRV